MGKFMLMPKLDMSMEEGVIVDWLVKKGDKVEKGDLVVEIETGKVNLEVDNTAAAGTVLAFYAEAGDRIAVNEPIMFIGEEGEDIPKVEKKTAAPASTETVFSDSKSAASSAPSASTAGYDLAVVGGGPGGYVAAIRAAQLGAKVVLFEDIKVGGVCLNRGCIPTKALIKSGDIWRHINEAGEHGISVSKPSFDWSRVMKRKDGVVTKLTSGVEGLLKKNKVDLVSAHATLSKVGDSVTLTANGKSYSAAKVILAAGSASVSIPLKGDDSVPVYSAETILSLATLPKNLVIIGGGVIGCEMAGLYAAFGVNVTVVELQPNLIPGADGDVQKIVFDIMKKQGITLKLKTTVQNVKKGKTLFSDGSDCAADAILMAVGRKVPESFMGSTVGTDLGLAVSERGWVNVDENLATNLPGVYAIGDITGGVQLAHTASAQGTILSENLFGEGKMRPLGAIPSCVFTSPEIAWIGLTEEEAKAKGLPVKTSSFPFAALGKAISAGETDGWVKLVVDSRWDEILGVHIVGANASALIGEAVALMGLEATAEEVTHMVHPHPTLTEGFLEAAEGIHIGPIHS